jgi:L-fuconolactonase
MPLVKGIRRLIQSEAPGFCIQPDFVRGVQLLSEYGFSFDICVRHHQLADTVTLVEQCPEVQFVLDHIGKPDIKAGLLSPWQEHIHSLANFPNVMCKLSGMITEADSQSWSAADLKPYFDTVLEAFGVERVMYGSDTPVIQLVARHENWLATVLDALNPFSPLQIEQMMSENARRFYRLPPSA